MIRLLFKEEDWTKNIDSLRIFGNAMTMFDESTRHVLMKSVLKEYQCLADKKEDTQLRIAEICINYLYNSQNCNVDAEIKKSIFILEKLPKKPIFDTVNSFV